MLDVYALAYNVEAVSLDTEGECEVVDEGVDNLLPPE